MVGAAQPYYLLLHGHDERDKNNADGGSSLLPHGHDYLLLHGGMMRGTRIMLMVMVAALTNYLLSDVHDGKDKNNADYGSSSDAIDYCRKRA